MFCIKKQQLIHCIIMTFVFVLCFVLFQGEKKLPFLNMFVSFHVYLWFKAYFWIMHIEVKLYGNSNPLSGRMLYQKNSNLISNTSIFLLISVLFLTIGLIWMCEDILNKWSIFVFLSFLIVIPNTALQPASLQWLSNGPSHWKGKTRIIRSLLWN